MWTIIIIALVVSLMVGPIMMMRPTKRDAKEAKLRLMALSLGLKVTMKKHPNDRARRVYPLYFLPWPPIILKKYPHQLDWSLHKQAFDHDLHFHHTWDWSTDNQAPESWHSVIKNCLDSLCNDDLALCSSRVGLGIMWNENLRGMGMDKAIERLQYTLGELSDRCI